MLTKETILNLPIHAQAFAGAKDASSQCIWITHMAAEAFDFSNANDLIGLKEYEVESVKEFAEQYPIHDKAIMTSGNSGVFIESGILNSKLSYGLCTKIPFYDNTGTVGGIYWSNVLIGSESQLSLINSIQQSIKPIYGNNKSQLQVSTETLKY